MAKQATVKARGIRNNNPGNIDFNKANPWQGQVGIETGVPKPRFAKFEAPTYGIRAIARLLITYYDKHKCDTVAKVINRWAPAHENNTRSYALAVAQKCGVGLNEKIDLHDHTILRPVVCAIIEHENGLKSYKQVYADDVIDKGLTLAGVEPPRKPLPKTATYQGAAVTTVGIAGGAVVDIAKEASTTLQPLVDYSDTLRVVFVILTLVGVAVTVWARLQQRKKGIA